MQTSISFQFFVANNINYFRWIFITKCSICNWNSEIFCRQQQCNTHSYTAVVSLCSTVECSVAVVFTIVCVWICVCWFSFFVSLSFWFMYHLVLRIRSFLTLRRYFSQRANISLDIFHYSLSFLTKLKWSNRLFSNNLAGWLFNCSFCALIIR